MEDKNGILYMLERFFRVQLEEWVAFVVISAIICSVAAFQLASTGKIGPESQDLVVALTDILRSITDYLSSGGGWARFFLFGFWFIIGTLAYFAAWFVINVIVDLYNDIVISSSFIHPRSFHQSDYWASIISRIVLRVLAAIALGFYTLFWFWAFAPFAVGQAKLLISGGLGSGEVIGIILTALGVVLTVHIAVILLRFTLLKPSNV